MRDDTLDICELTAGYCGASCAAATAPSALESVEYVGVVDGETDRAGGSVHAMLEGIVADGFFALGGIGAGTLFGVGPIGRHFAF